MLKFVSMYEALNLHKEDLEFYRSIYNKVAEDFILCTDLIAEIEQISPYKSDELYCFKASLNGLDLLFELGQIHNTDHQEYLEEITFLLIESSRGKGMSLADRIDLICEAWRDFFANPSNHQ